LIRYPDLDFTRATYDIIPLVVGTPVFEIWYEFDATHEDVVAEIISKSISPPLGFLRTQVTLQGYF
jgi:hypothetical protein